MSRYAYWYIHYPSDAYAMGPIELPADYKEADVRKYAREFSGCYKLPNGFSCWKSNT